jgi:L-lactate dehydrogenase complex protein LldG
LKAVTASRETILNRIRPATLDAQDAERDYAAIPREYTTEAAGGEARLHLFLDRLHEYDAQVFEASPDAIAPIIASVLERRGKQRMAIPEGLPPQWLPQGFAFITADHLSHAELDRLDGIVSGCTLAIALTGTLVLQNAPAQGPRALSLIPDYHLCVVFADQVVGTVPEAFAQLSATSHLPTTFISGPSATADIEMTRIKGVHGPRFLDVVLVR